jgi:transposase InsO family protein
MPREELRIIRGRMRRVPSNRRPQYTGLERMAILQLRAMRGWNRKRVATSWSPMTRSETGCAESTMAHSCKPQHRSIGFRMSYVTPREQIKLFYPTLGKLKIAEKLARAGIHIGKSTVERILKERPVEPKHPTDENGDKRVRIVSKYPGHTWNADLTAVPVSGGFWTPWIPTAISPRWPVCWWVLSVIDHFSRRSVGCGVFRSRPTSAEVTAVLDRIMSAEQMRPKHLIVDQGSEFKCEHFEHVWCKAQDILPRFGAVGQHGSIAVVERFHRTLKDLLRLTTIPEDQTAFERELELIVDWYNEHRPHETSDGKTPNEVHYARPAANERPRFEPRGKWPRGSPCAAPAVGLEGAPGDPIIFEIDWCVRPGGVQV